LVSSWTIAFFLGDRGSNLPAVEAHALRRPDVPFDIRAGLVLYTGGATPPFGPKLRAVPVNALW
jgi:hypothetical protein